MKRETKCSKSGVTSFLIIWDKMTKTCLIKLLSIDDIGYVWLSPNDIRNEYQTLISKGLIETSGDYKEENGTFEQKKYVLSRAGDEIIECVQDILGAVNEW